MAEDLGRRPGVRGRGGSLPGPSTTSSRCIPTPRAASIWATSGTTPSATSSPASRRCRASTSSTPSAGTPWACRPRTPPSSTASIPGRGRWTTSPTCANQLKKMGFGYDWSREVNSCLPEYYRWNQWIFLKMFERGLAFRKESWVNWCPQCRTVLANEQVVAGGCWRCDTPVVAEEDGAVVPQDHRLRRGAALGPRRARQVARARPPDAEELDRQEHGGPRHVRGPGAPEPIEVFTTRIDTIYGATFLVLSPEHPMALDLVASSPRRAEHEAWIATAVAAARTRREIGDDEKEGIDTGATAVNPFTGELVPVWIANYVLMDYGTGAIMAVPAHDQRDHDFATKYGLPIKTVIVPGGPEDGGPRGGEGLRASRRPREFRPVRRAALRRGHGQDGRPRRGEGLRPAEHDVPPPRLGHLPPAVLGDAHPDHLLPEMRRRRRPLRGPAGRDPLRRRHHRRRGLSPRAGPKASSERPAPSAAARPGARPTPWTRSSIRPGISSATRPRARRRLPFRPDGREVLASGRPLHRRRRARHPPSHLRAVLHQGPPRPRPDRYRRAVPALPGPGDGHQGRVGHVQVEGEYRRSRRDPQEVRRRHPPAVHPLRLASGKGVRLGGGGARGVPQVPAPGLDRGPREPGPVRGRRSGSAPRPAVRARPCCERPIRPSAKSPRTSASAST